MLNSHPPSKYICLRLFRFIMNHQRNIFPCARIKILKHLKIASWKRATWTKYIWFYLHVYITINSLRNRHDQNTVMLSANRALFDWTIDDGPLPFHLRLFSLFHFYLLCYLLLLSLSLSRTCSFHAYGLFTLHFVTSDNLLAASYHGNENWCQRLFVCFSENKKSISDIIKWR